MIYFLTILSKPGANRTFVNNSIKKLTDMKAPIMAANVPEKKIMMTIYKMPVLTTGVTNAARTIAITLFFLAHAL